MVSHQSLFLKEKKVDFTRFECLLLKFPPLGEAIFDNLNNQSVAKCAEVNEMIQNIIYKDKFYWTRQIRSFFGTSNVFKNDWEKVLKKPCIKMVKMMNSGIQDYLPLPQDLLNFPPHFIAIRINSDIAQVHDCENRPD